MSVCANCGTPQGPFRRDPDFPNKPVCAAPVGSTPSVQQQVIRECLSRRAKKDEAEG